jgi:hypothetical protein
MAYVLPLGVCLVNAERRISDAAHAFEIVMRQETPSDELKRGARADMLDYEREAREFYAEAEKSGWSGDIDGLIAQHWAIYLPQVSAETIAKLRAKALEEAAGKQVV